jgi:hypothetical protein
MEEGIGLLALCLFFTRPFLRELNINLVPSNISPIYISVLRTFGQGERITRCRDNPNEVSLADFEREDFAEVTEQEQEAGKMSVCSNSTDMALDKSSERSDSACEEKDAVVESHVAESEKDSDVGKV